MATAVEDNIDKGLSGLALDCKAAHHEDAIDAVSSKYITHDVQHFALPSARVLGPVLSIRYDEYRQTTLCRCSVSTSELICLSRPSRVSISAWMEDVPRNAETS